VTVIRFRPQGGAEGFFNPQGESVVRSFLRTPMDTSRVTSGFGMREHPILGFSAMHAGVDFAAASGTPILAAGNGKVVMAGPNGGYGNYVKLQHTHDVATAYAHMSRIGPGIKPGAVVRQGQVIGFVGSTGRISITSSCAAASTSIRWRRNSPCAPWLRARMPAVSRHWRASISTR